MLYYKLLDFFEKQFTESKDYIKECELDIFYEIKVKQQCTDNLITHNKLKLLIEYNIFLF
jgi:hypothetical protein